MSYLELNKAKRRDIDLWLFHCGNLDFKVVDLNRGKQLIAMPNVYLVGNLQTFVRFELGEHDVAAVDVVIDRHFHTD